MKVQAPSDTLEALESFATGSLNEEEAAIQEEIDGIVSEVAKHTAAVRALTDRLAAARRELQGVAALHAVGSASDDEMASAARNEEGRSAELREMQARLSELNRQAADAGKRMAQATERKMEAYHERILRLQRDTAQKYADALFLAARLAYEVGEINHLAQRNELLVNRGKYIHDGDNGHDLFGYRSHMEDEGFTVPESHDLKLWLHY